MKAVLDTKPDSGYDDEIANRYHFPSQYRARLTRCIGDWVVFRRPRAGGGDLAYFAVGRINRIDADAQDSKLHYAIIEDFLPFDTPVPWRQGGRYAERSLREVQEQSQIGARLRGNAVRQLEAHDFNEIVAFGLSKTLLPENARKLGLDESSIDPATKSLIEEYALPGERRVEEMLVNRKIRDARFRAAVCEAYEDRCAVTGLQIINGGGRAEVQAAHVWPVKDGGPDIVQNGIALSATAHWLFDRHLISLSDDYRLLVSHNKVPPEFRNLFPAENQQIHLPEEPRLWPRQAYVEMHRERFVSG